MLVYIEREHYLENLQLSSTSRELLLTDVVCNVSNALKNA